MKIGNWNVRSLAGKEIEVTEEMEKYKVEILGITGTKKKGRGEQLLNNNYMLMYSGVEQKEGAKKGVGLIVKQSLVNNIEEWKYRSARLMSVDMQIDRRSVRFIVAYAPNEDAPKEERCSFYLSLQETLEDTKSNQQVILLGDFNARVGLNPYRTNEAVGTEGEDQESDNGEQLIDFCVRNELKIANTFFPHKNIHKWTRVNLEQNERSILDYFIVNNSMFYSVLDVRVQRGAELYTDHYLVVAKIRMMGNKANTPTKETKISKIKVEKLKDEETREAYRKEIDMKISAEISELGLESTLEEKWKAYKEAILSSAEKICGTKIIGGPKKITPWWNEEVKAKVKEKKTAWKKYIATGRNEDKENYNLKRSEVKKIVKMAKEKSWEDFGIKLQDNYKENIKLFWGAVKRARTDRISPIKHINNSKGERMRTSQDIRETWREYFEKLHNELIIDSEEPENETQEPEESDAQREYAEEEITVEEVQRAIKKLKFGKAAGPDKIYPEMVKYQSGEANKILWEIIKEAWNTKTVPNDWLQSLIIPIHKSGSTTDCKNYRGISLMSIPGKIYARILEERAKIGIEEQLDEHQSGFRGGRSVQDHIFTLRQIIEKTIEYDNELHLCFVDLQKAFDSVQRKQLWKALEEHQVDNSLREAIRSFYHSPESRVRIDGKTSEPFKIKVGVRQGCILSPLLFITFMNSVGIECQPKMKPTFLGMRKLRPVYATLLSFADDLVIFGKTESDLQINLNAINDVLKTKGMTINDLKTKTMIINREEINHSIKLGTIQLKQVNSYKYLGVIISSNGKNKDELTRRIGNGAKIYGQLSNTFIKKKELSNNTKLAIYKTVYCPTIMYASESWVLNTAEKSKIQAAEMKFLRRIVGKSKRDRIRNVRIREELQCEPMLNKIRKAQLRWFGHVNRMGEDRLAKKALEYKVQGRRPRGRPRRRWEDEVSDILRERGKNFKEEKRKSMNRDYWKRLVREWTSTP